MNCVLCGDPLHGKATETRRGWAHPQCASLGEVTGATRGADSLSSGWLVLLYVSAVLIPFGMWIVVIVSSVLFYAWRKEFPTRAKHINRHGWIAWVLGSLAWAAAWVLWSSNAESRQALPTAEPATVKIKKERPQTEAALKALLGEPTTTTELSSYRMVMWYYETKEVGRDVIAANVDKQGRISAMQY
jgi:hypothetical protein